LEYAGPTDDCWTFIHATTTDGPTDHGNRRCFSRPFLCVVRCEVTPG
jgi:hypothetical protein